MISVERNIFVDILDDEWLLRNNITQEDVVFWALSKAQLMT